MKKITYYIIITLIIVVSLFFILTITVETNVVEPPQKPKNVPETAIWSGGLDGGYWFEFNNYNRKTQEYSFTLYEETAGAIVINDKIIQKDSCIILPVDNRILENINFFANDEIVLDICTLKKVK